MLEIYKEIINIQTNGGEAALATIISTKSHTPRHVGTKMLIKSSGEIIGTIGGGDLEKKVCQEALKVIKEGNAKIIHYDLTGKKGSNVNMICGGVMDVFVEPVLSSPLLYIFGGGHVSVPISQIAKIAGFKVVVIDERKEYANSERFPDADKVICENFNEVFSKINISKSSYIIIVTTEHGCDMQILEKAIKTPATYIGMMGSTKKRDMIFSSIESRGTAKDLFKKVHCPVGIEINSETPEEIAVSIVAEMIKHRRNS